MRVVITGGTGMVGRALSADLMAAGHEVVVLSRHPWAHPNLPPGVHAVRWDARSAAGWGQVADGAGAIVNLAGASLAKGRWTADRKRTIRESRLNVGLAVAQAVEGATPKPRVVIQASAVGYYGPQGDEEITESHPPGHDFLARTCVEWEASTAPVEAAGVRRAIIRSGLILDAKDGALPRLALPFRFFVGGPLGNGRQWYPWIHIADEVAAIRFLIENETASGPFDLTAPDPVNNAAFARILGRVLRRPSLFRVSAFPMRLLLGEMSTTVLTGQRVLPHQLQEAGFTFRFPEIEAALHDLIG
ncbi:MAG: TIGR01777 family oxidoreductase [Dehalococcoidales bacterium]|nr:TIGR01777 family oxidoreductase [Dehalococcoidales bacterium]